mgnify:CR=1 FL=1
MNRKHQESGGGKVSPPRKALRQGAVIGVSGSTTGHARSWKALLGLLVVGLTTACRVPPPTVQQGLEFGFRTPKQAFESWRTAVQGDLLVEEYRCFSRRWRARNGVTLLKYGEARDELLSEVPKLRWALYRADAAEFLDRQERSALLVARVPGPLWVNDQYLLVTLRRQGFWELSVEDTPLEPEFGDQVEDPFRSQLFWFDKEGDRFFVIVDEFGARTEGADPDSIHLVAAGWEWKIDDFTVVDELPEGIESIE